MDIGRAHDLLSEVVTEAGRMALGDGLSRGEVFDVIQTAAQALLTQDCAEDMSPIYRADCLIEVKMLLAIMPENREELSEMYDNPDGYVKRKDAEDNG